MSVRHGYNPYPIYFISESKSIALLDLLLISELDTIILNNHVLKYENDSK